MSLAAAGPLIAASLDLQLVRLIRGAINANRREEGQPCDDRPLRQHRDRPAAVSAERVIYRDLPAVAPVDRTRTERTSEVVEVLVERPTLPPAVGPLPAPWQVLLREKVWNRPIEVPPPVVVAKAYATPTPLSGSIVDAFL